MSSSDPVESLYPFPNEVIIERRAPAIDFARHAFSRGRIDRCFVIWVDGSVQPRLPRKREVISASAVGWLDSSSSAWIESVTLSGLEHSTACVMQAELTAIREAFRIAYDRVDEFDRLTIFSDSQPVLKGLRDQSTFSFLPGKGVMDDVLWYANRLYDLGLNVELRWVPGHSHVKGNERVDKLARRSRKLAVEFLSQAPPKTKVRNAIIITQSSRMDRRNLPSLIALQLSKGSETISKRETESST